MQSLQVNIFSSRNCKKKIKPSKITNRFCSQKQNNMSKVVTFGEIMLRLATPDHQRFTQANSLCVSFGGGEANVAVSLANLGIPVEYVTRLPENDFGQAVIMDPESIMSELSMLSREVTGLEFIFLKPVP
jgi:hypothetical protein